MLIIRKEWKVNILLTRQYYFSLKDVVLKENLIGECLRQYC